MDIGFETIGNATIIVHDQKPVLVTDPWIQGSAYFGSWRLSHEIPEEQRTAILEAPLVWFSHGHPDHLNPDSLPLFKDREILLPDHVGGRIKNELLEGGFRVRVLPDRQWITISERVRVLCIADIGQDAVLLIDVGGRLLINSNDCGDNGWGGYVERIARKYPISFLLRLSGYGDADMINFYDETGNFIVPECAKKRPIGRGIAATTERLGATHFIPFSSMHRYQREDSAWADIYTAGLSEYGNGFHSRRCSLLPAFIKYDCRTDNLELINPREVPSVIVPAAQFGDNWSDELEKDDVKSATQYFQAIEHLKDQIGFINLRVGKKDNRIVLNPKLSAFGITFECPRQSLTTAIQFQIFEDLLIGNFMKTTLNGPWETKATLHPYFSGYVAKFADNGRAKTRAEVVQYIRTYESRSWGLRMKNLEGRIKSGVEIFVPRRTFGFRLLKSMYQSTRRFALAK